MPTVATRIHGLHTQQLRGGGAHHSAPHRDQQPHVRGEGHGARGGAWHPLGRREIILFNQLLYIISIIIYNIYFFIIHIIIIRFFYIKKISDIFYQIILFNQLLVYNKKKYIIGAKFNYLNINYSTEYGKSLLVHGTPN